MRKVFILSASFLWLFTACKKDGDLNPEFQDNTSFTSFTDSFTVQTKTIAGDPIIADQIETGLVGSYKDSVFGLSNSQLYLQALLPTNFLVLGEANETLITDSVVLSLVYDGFYGDETTSQTFEVHRLGEALNSNTTYLSDTSINTVGGLLGSKTFIPKLDKEVSIQTPALDGTINTEILSPQLRIKLDNALGAEILSKSGQAELFSNEAFTQFFKGVKISPALSTPPNNNQNSILYFGVTNSETKISLYYKAITNQGDTTNKVVDFPINSTSIRFNTFSHDFSSGVVNNVINNNNKDQLYSYTQSMAGVNTLIQFPSFLERFKDENIVINKAELVIPAIGGSYVQNGFAEGLIVVTKNEEGNLQVIPDVFEGESHFGGGLSVPSDTYTFNISRYMQAMLNGQSVNNELTLLVSNSARNGERVVFGAQKNERKIKLNLFYSKTE